MFTDALHVYFIVWVTIIITTITIIIRGFHIRELSICELPVKKPTEGAKVLSGVDEDKITRLVCMDIKSRDVNCLR